MLNIVAKPTKIYLFSLYLQLIDYQLFTCTTKYIIPKKNDNKGLLPYKIVKLMTLYSK
jgi:hypothetical protein